MHAYQEHCVCSDCTVQRLGMQKRRLERRVRELAARQAAGKSLTPRADVYRAIDRERDHQDVKWGLVDEHPHEVGAWILIMESVLEDARKAWQRNHGDEQALAAIQKVVATGCACLEQHGTVART